MKILLVGLRNAIEPVGTMYLAGVARAAGWDVAVELIRDRDYAPLIDRVVEEQPDLVAITVWTGSHRQAFAAADTLLQMGARVALGGAHVTHFSCECAKHATWTVVGDGFRVLRQILEGKRQPGVHFDDERMADGFPSAYRDPVYERYPELRTSPIKSVMASAGCVYSCHYCYSSAYNALYPGTRPHVRPVDDVIREAREIRDRWPAQLIFLSDDVFGLDVAWVEEFCRRWPAEVGTPWHCQIRLELTRDPRRLDLFRDGGCTGVTLAVENANPWLRKYVLGRDMSNELIEQGVRAIQERGLTVRTEQIMGVPFSDLESDLATLALNVRLAPDLAWASILAPYRGTMIGEMAVNCGMYRGRNDDLSDSFFVRSVLRHVRHGRHDVERVVANVARGPRSPLVDACLLATDQHRAALAVGDRHVTFEYLSAEENDRYCSQMQTLQQLFPWFARQRSGERLARRFLAREAGERTWRCLGRLAEEEAGLGRDASACLSKQLREESGCPQIQPIEENPWYFATMPASVELTRRTLQAGVFDGPDPFPELGRVTRAHLFEHALYRIKPYSEPMLKVVR